MPTDIDGQHRRLAEVLARALRLWHERHPEPADQQVVSNKERAQRASVPASGPVTTGAD